MKTLKEELIELKACEEAIKWVGEKTPEEAWNTCERGDWMWWLIWKTESATKEQSVRFADFCANNAKERAAALAESAASAAWAAERAAWAAWAAWAAALAESAAWAAFAERAARAAERVAAWAALAESAASAAALADSAANVAEWSLERKKQADFIRTIFKREDIKI